MIKVGELNTVRVVKKVDFGVYLDGGEYGEILLPKRYVPAACKVNDMLEVFIYLDSEDRLIATTQQPRAMVGDFALLKVVAVNKVGAFLDWGLPKDLLAPFGEQKIRMEVGRSYVVRVFFDEHHRHIAASTKLGKFLPEKPPACAVGDAVSLLLCTRTDLGYKVLINDAYWGLLFTTDIFQPVALGDRMNGFIKRVRSDGKIDVCLQKPGYEKVGGIAEQIMDRLETNAGFLPLTDASSPADIHAAFGVSKKTFKQAIGTLYKQHRITIENDGIRKTKKTHDTGRKK